jgi:transcriptional regulator with XRE-family HTH domain
MKRPKTIRPPKPALAHIAEAIQKYLKAESLSMQEFGRRLGLPGHNKTSIVRAWAFGLYAPTERYRELLAKFFNLEPAFFLPRPEAVGPARQARALVSSRKEIVVAKMPGETKLLRAFEEHDDGTATIKLNARLPLAKAREIFSLLIEVSL